MEGRVTAATLYATGAVPLLDPSEPAEAPRPQRHPLPQLLRTGVRRAVGMGPGCGCGPWRAELELRVRPRHFPLGAVLLWVWGRTRSPSILPLLGR